MDPEKAILLASLFETSAKIVKGLRALGRADSLSIDDSKVRTRLVDHLGTVDKWSQTISLLILTKEKILKDNFIELDLDSGVRRFGPNQDPRERVSIADLYSSEGHLAILGRPGAGKTTSLQMIAGRAVDDWCAGRSGPPLLVRLRDLRPDVSLAGHLCGLLGIVITAGPGTPKGEIDDLQLRLIKQHLAQFAALLLLDGLDEVHASVRDQVERELREIALTPGAHRIFLTCRSIEYRGSLQHVTAYTIRPLTPEQVALFATKWLGAERAVEFIAAVSRLPYAGAEMVPLNLAHLCALFERDRQLPRRPIEVYEMIVSLAVEEWDRQRGVARQSRYPHFLWRKKERFLAALAYELAMIGRKGVFEHGDLEQAYARVRSDYQLPRGYAVEVLEEVESHTGIIHQSGYRRYDFSHLVIQEYLVAVHATLRGRPVGDLVAHLMPHELALVIAHSAGADELLEESLHAILEGVQAHQQAEFLQTFVGRLAQERPVLHSSTRLGWVLIALADRLVNAEGASAMDTDAMLFFDDEVVSSALGLAGGQARRSHQEQFIDIAPQDWADLPKWLRSLLPADNVRFRLPASIGGVLQIKAQES